MNKTGLLILVTILAPLFAEASDAVPSEVDLCSSKSLPGVDPSIQNFITPACDSGLSMRKAVAAQLEAASQQKGGNVGAAGGLGGWIGGSQPAAAAVTTNASSNVGGGASSGGTAAVDPSAQTDQSSAVNLYK